jgi:hypothetical protein
MRRAAAIQASRGGADGSRIEEPRTGTLVAERVSGIAKRAHFEGEAAATDALVQPVAQTDELHDALIQELSPTARQPVPIARRRCSAFGKRG